MNKPTKAPLSKKAGVRLLRLKQVCEITGLTRPTLYRLLKIGAFPLPIKLTDEPRSRSVAWIEPIIYEWTEQRIERGAFTPEEWRLRCEDVKRHTQPRPELRFAANASVPSKKPKAKGKRKEATMSSP